MSDDTKLLWLRLGKLGCLLLAILMFVWFVGDANEWREAIRRAAAMCASYCVGALIGEIIGALRHA